MNILITVATYFPLKDGVQKVTQYQAENLVKLGHNVFVITSNCGGKFKDKEKINGVNIYRVDATNKNMLHFGDYQQYKKRVYDIIERENIDVMMNVCLESFSADWVLKFISNLKCKKILMMHSMHDFRWNKNDFSSFSNFTKKILRDIRWGIFYKSNINKIKMYDAYIHLHEDDYSLNFFKKYKIDNNYIIYNAADDVFFENNVIKKNMIINVGSYNSRKNQKGVMKIFYEASTKDYELVLIGNPSNKYYDDLIKLKKTFDKKFEEKKVTILCNIDRKTTIDYLKKSSIYLSASTWEGFPISIVESMAAGGTFISTDVGILNKIPGGVVSDDYNKLVDYLSEFCNNGYKENSLIAKEYASNNFVQIKQVKKLEKVMKKVLEE